jgi:subtilisin family serine protease
VRTLFASVSLIFLGSAILVAQIARRPAIPQRPPQETGTYLVSFRRDVPLSQRPALVQASGARLKKMYAAVNAASVEIPDAAAMARLRNDPRVVSVYANRRITLSGLQGRGGAGGSGGAKPKAPTNLAATAVSSSQINLAWSDNSNNETGFEIDRCAGSGCSNFIAIAQVGTDVNAFGDVGLAIGTLYRYRVVAFNGAGSSKDSNIAEATTPALPPTAPSNLTSTVVSSSQINLSWSDNSSNEDGFRIERCNLPAANCLDANFAQITQTAPNVTSFNDTGLQPQTTHTYRVRAFNSTGTSNYSNSVQATTLNVPPTAPSNLISAGASSSQINLSWSDNSSNEDGFRIERCNLPAASCLDVNFTQITQTVANVTSFNDTGLVPQTKYTYRLRAFNSAGTSAYSNLSEATTQAVPPTAPSNLISAGASSSQINLSWSDNSSNEDGFRIERCNLPAASCLDANFAQITQTAANVTSFNDTGLQPQTTHTYRVRAFNSAGMSAYSNLSEAMTQAVPPTAPSNLSSLAASSSQINLSWSDNSSNEDGFRLERCDLPAASCLDVNFTQITQTAPNVTSFNDTGLLPQTKYTYRVRAFNSAGMSAYSNLSEATTQAVPPTAPSNLSSLAASSSQINLSWSDNSTSEDGFRLERCNSPAASCLDANFTQITQTAPNVTSFNDTGLLAGTTYTYRVRAFNSAGNSSYSNSVEGTTLPTPPSAPGNLAVSDVSYNQISLSWLDNSTNENGFRIERCNQPAANCLDANFVQIAQTFANVTTFTNIGLQGQTTYSYRVRAFNSGGMSSYSNSVQALTPAAPPSTQVVPGGVQRIGAAPGRVNWTGAGVGVAVVDTGLDFNHQDLALVPEIQGVNSFNAFGGSCQDFHGHGTHVGGIIAARDNNIDVVGVAPNATLYCVNVFQPDPVEGATGTDEDLIAGLNWIAQNANLVTPRIRVVNMSLGRPKTPEDDDPNHPVHLAVKALYDMGISVVVAAGNDPSVEVTQQVPAGYPEVMAVASTTAAAGVNGYDEFFPACTGVQNIKSDTASYFTTDGRFIGGTGVTISAPGEQQEDLFSYFDSCFLESIGILSTALDGGTVELSGTSMASPHVAGVVALMWEKDLSLGLTLSPELARTQIRNGAARVGTAPLDSPEAEYTFDGEREGVIWAPAALGDEPPPPQDQPPSVSIQSPTTGSNFSAGANITFQATATDPEDGNIAPSLVWTSSRDGQIGTGAGFTRTLTSGNHVITASVTDSGGNSANATTSITVGSASNPTKVLVNSVTYSLQGTTLVYTVKVVNEFGGPVAGATVDVDIYEYVFTGNLWISSGTSNSQGNTQFQLPNADLGCYVTSVRNVTANGLTFVFGTPDNNFCIGF